MSAFPKRRSTEDETIEAMAAAWLAQRDEGLTTEEEQEFARWRAGDPRREAVVLRLERTWTTLQGLRDFRPEARAHPDCDLLVSGRRGRRNAWPLAGLLVGAAALVVAAFGIRRDEPRTPEYAAPSVRTFVTAPEGFQKVALPDGSIVTINGGSELRVAYAHDERRVTLLRGEAHFAVAKDSARPFWVEAGAMTVRAVGTAFNVRMQTTAVEVLVTEGRVEVDDTRTPAADADEVMDALARRLRAVLHAGERIKVALDALPSDAATVAVEKIPPEAVRADLAWRDAWLVFSDTPLSEAVAQFNARNELQIELGDAQLATLAIGGTFRVENVDGFVRLLAASNNVTADRSSPGRIVLRGSPGRR